MRGRGRGRRLDDRNDGDLNATTRAPNANTRTPHTATATAATTAAATTTATATNRDALRIGVR